MALCIAAAACLLPADAVNPPAHTVAIEGGSRLAAAVGGAPLAVNSHHHQCVKRLAPGFRVAARAPDGVVEAIECDTYPAAGVQFHPESLVACKPKDPGFEIARLRRVLSEIGRLCESPATNYVPSAAAERRISVMETRLPAALPKGVRRSAVMVEV